MLYQCTATIDVAKGPDKLGIFISAYNAYDERRPSEVQFIDDAGFKHTATIKSIQHEDGSGQSFNITGSIDYRHPENHIVYTGDFTGYYNAKSGIGHLTITYLLADDKPG